MVLLAAHAVNLRRQSDPGDLVVPVYSAGRPRRDLQEVVGFFLNVLPIRFDVTGRMTFADAVATTRTALLGALANEEVPFDRLLTEVPELALALANEHQLIMPFQALPPSADPERIGDVAIRRLDLASVATAEPTPHDQLWTLDPSTGTGTVRFDSGLFELAQVQRSVADIAAVLRRALQDPELVLDDLAPWAASDSDDLAAATT